MSPTDWSSLKVVDLRAELSNRGLPTKGIKAELIARLNEDDAAQTEEPEVQDEATNGDTHVASNESDSEAPEKDGGADAAAPGPSLTVAPEAVAVRDSNTGVEAAAAPEQNTSDTDNVAETPAIEKPIASEPSVAQGTTIESPTRKRRFSRSRTPPPSAKRARKEPEIEVEDREDIVDFDTDDIHESVHGKQTNGVEHGHAEKVETSAQNSAVEQNSQTAPEGSGEEAYLNRVAIAGSFDRPESSTEAQEASLKVSGDEAYLERTATADGPKAPSPLAEGQSIHDKDGDVEMEDAVRTTSEGHETVSRQEDTSGDVDEAFEPSTHHPTSALYIRELMRPLKPEVMEQHIVDLMTPEGNDPDPSLIEEFYIDQIRTHAFIQLTSVLAAKRVRAALHNQIWPNESNRKPLWVDFVPSSQVKDWITEETEGNGTQSRRWEVVYEQQGSEIVAVHKTVGSNSKSFSKPPPTGPAAGSAYPGIEAAPRGPRGRGTGSRLDTPNSLLTQAHPRLSYTPLSDDVARRRVDNMRSFYSANPPQDLGKNYHRFTFENVDSFVDRGVEVFIGIRPPHREKEHQERLRREQQGTAGAGNVAESRRNDFRPRPAVTDEDRFPRYGDSRRPERRGRNRGFRGGRRFQGEDPYRYRPGY